MPLVFPPTAPAVLVMGQAQHHPAVISDPAPLQVMPAFKCFPSSRLEWCWYTLSLLDGLCAFWHSRIPQVPVKGWVCSLVTAISGPPKPGNSTLEVCLRGRGRSVLSKCNLNKQRHSPGVAICKDYGSSNNMVILKKLCYDF